MLLEYLFYGEAIRADLLYHNKQYISRSVGNANKCSIYQKPPIERKGDFKGKEFPLDYLDCKVVRAYGGSYFPKKGPEKYEEKKRIFIQAMQELGKYAQNLNVCLAIENHFNTLTYDATHSVNVVSEINSPGVGILYDQANLGLVGAEDYREAISIQVPYIIHVHVKDFAYKGDDRAFSSSSVTGVTGIAGSERIVRFKVTGEGIVPWPAIIRLLREIGYKGFLSLEYTYWKNPKDLPPPEIGMKKEGDFLKTVLAF